MSAKLATRRGTCEGVDVVNHRPKRTAPRPRETARVEPVTLPPCIPERVCSVWLPVATRNPTNERGATKWRGARDAWVRATTTRVVAPVFAQHRVTVPCAVVLVRIAPRGLDSDNAEASLKRVRDGVADALGVDDADPRVSWVVEQRKGPSKTRGVIVEVYPRGLAATKVEWKPAAWFSEHAAELDVVLPILRGGR